MFVWGGIIALLLLLANVLTRKVSFIRKSLMPVAALAGFILLALRATGLLRTPTELLEMVTYHGIAIGFIALSLRTTKTEVGGVFAFKSDSLSGTSFSSWKASVTREPETGSGAFGLSPRRFSTRRVYQMPTRQAVR